MTSKLALYRLDFRVDLTSAEAPTINLGYMLEAAVDTGFRFLGLASRKALTRLEQDLINLHTWPELGDVDEYMGRLFDRAWKHVCTAETEDLRLGSELLACEHTSMSALYFASFPIEQLGVHLGGEIEDLERELHGALIELGRGLRPALTAPVLPLTPSPAREEPAPQRKIRFEAEYGLELAA